jgi:hypothetical protein
MRCASMELTLVLMRLMVESSVNVSLTPSGAPGLDGPVSDL